MAKNLDDVIVITEDTSKDEITELLNKGKTLLLSAHKGPIVKASLTKGYSDYFQANIAIASEGVYPEVCGCGKRCNIKLYLWKD
ncbi:MAG: hypothetical protein REH79_03225 [Spiroplasma sp.]|nr:hypothetical protein [Spiroplasma sp.]